ncbi:hypothetical protein EZS27_042959, partial [termite gut metagenome]
MESLQIRSNFDRIRTIPLPARVMLYYPIDSAHFILIIVYLEVHIFPYICPIVFQYNIYFLPD